MSTIPFKYRRLFPPPVGLSFRASACQSLSNSSLSFLFLPFFFLVSIVAPPPCLSRGRFAPLALFLFIIYCSSRRVPERLFTQPPHRLFFIFSESLPIHPLLLSKSSFTCPFCPHCKPTPRTFCGASWDVLRCANPTFPRSEIALRSPLLISGICKGSGWVPLRVTDPCLPADRV